VFFSAPKASTRLKLTGIVAKTLLNRPPFWILLKSSLPGARNKESTGFPHAQNEGPTNDIQLFDMNYKKIHLNLTQAEGGYPGHQQEITLKLLNISLFYK